MVRRIFHLPAAPRSIDREVDAELRFHLEARVDDLVRRGVPRHAASEQALREFGDVGAAHRELAAIDRQHLGRERRAEWWGTLRQDVRYAARGLRRRPGFAAAALLTLALGIGATTAIFSVADAVLLRPLPYAGADRLVHLWETLPGEGAGRSEASYPDFVDWRAQARAFAGLEGYQQQSFALTGADEPAMLRGARVTPGFFALLGVSPGAGRFFRADEDVPGGAPVVVLAHGFWQRQFGGRRDAVGSRLLLNGTSYTVVGVLPRDFEFAPVGDADLWVPNDASEQLRDRRRNHWLNVVGRLRPGVTIAQARDDLAAVMRRLGALYPTTNNGRGIEVVPLRDQIVGQVRPLVLVLLGAVAFVLLITCANVAGLLLVRATARAREFAVRAALGAGRARVVRQLLTESTLLAVIGAAGGVLVAHLGVRLLVAGIPERVLRTMPYLRGAAIDTAALVFAAGVALACGVAFGLAPALQASRAGLGEVMRQDGRSSAGAARGRLRDALVVGEVALTLALLVGAGLMGRSLVRLLRLDPGFAADHVLTMRLALSAKDSTNEQALAFYAQLDERVRALPGVREAGVVSNLPLEGGGTNTFQVVGRPAPEPGRAPELTSRFASPGYFRVMRIPLVAGRPFDERDNLRSPPVILINRSLARQLFGDGRAAVGQRLVFPAFPDTAREIVGVVADVKTANLDADAPPTAYFSTEQNPIGFAALVVRTAADPADAAAAVGRAIRAVDADVPVYAVATMERQVGDSPAVFTRRYPLVLIAGFGVAALVLAVVGIYGVISYSVTQRTRELGIRIALGAAGGSILRLVVRRGALLAGAGIALGALIAAVLGRFIASLLYGVSATDPLTFAATAAVMAAVALAASYVPARRAARIDPVVALRSD